MLSHKIAAMRIVASGAQQARILDGFFASFWVANSRRRADGHLVPRNYSSIDNQV